MPPLSRRLPEDGWAIVNSRQPPREGQACAAYQAANCGGDTAGRPPHGILVHPTATKLDDHTGSSRLAPDHNCANLERRIGRQQPDHRSGW